MYQPAALELLLERVKSYNPESDLGELRRAFEFARGKYLELELDFKDVSVLMDIMLSLKPDDELLIAAMFYNLFVNDQVSEEKIAKEFGGGAAEILMSLQRLESLNYRENDKSAQLEMLRKMFLTMAKDIRVILLALIIRLFKMKFLENFVKEKNRILFVRETLDVYVQLASRLGVYTVKIELEDLAFKYIDSQQYKIIADDLKRFGKSQSQAIKYMKEKLEKFLSDRGYQSSVSGRLKSVYSVFKKLKRKDLSSVNDLYDVFAMRVVLPSQYDDNGVELVDHLYGVLGMLHSEWRPMTKRFKDYIAVPKPNGYRSLHTVVLGLPPKDMERPVEVQIRSEDMHKRAEYGQAAHWIYKQQAGGSGNKNLEMQVEWLKGLQRFQDDLAAESEIMKGGDLDLFKDRIFVLTPRGEVKDLPLGSTPIDFAYAVHTDIGHRCLMAKANGNIVPLDYEFHNGDVVEIITKKEAAPKLQWLSFVKTTLAKSKIKAFFSGMNKDHNVKEGKKLLNAQLVRLGKPVLDSSYSFLRDYLGRKLSFTERESLLEEVGKGSQLASDIIKKILPYEEILVKGSTYSDGVKFSEQIKEGTTRAVEGELTKHILVGGEEGLPMKIAACCKPGFGDKIVAYVTRGNRMTVHKILCPILDSLDSNRIMSATWKGGLKAKTARKYRVEIKAAVVPRVGLIRDMTSVISEFGMFIVDISIKGNARNLHDVHFLLEMEDLEQFDALMNRLENVKSVVKVVKR